MKHVTISVSDDMRAQMSEYPHKINWSALACGAFSDAMARWRTASVGDFVDVDLDLRDDDGNAYTGALTAKLLANDEVFDVYLTDDERIIVYHGGESRYFEIDDDSELEDLLPEGLYLQVCYALGLTPTIEI